MGDYHDDSIALPRGNLCCFASQWQCFILLPSVKGWDLGLQKGFLVLVTTRD